MSPSPYNFSDLSFEFVFVLFERSVEGGLAPLWSCGSMPLAPSFLTGTGSHMTLWTSVILHVAALALNLTANITFFINSTDATADLLWTWALTSLIAHSLAVVSTVVITGFVKDVFTTPLINTLLMGLFLGGLLATAKISYTHGLAQEATSTENVTYNLSLAFQAFAFGSILSNAIAAASSKGGI
jgi:hypothetical protein